MQRGFATALLLITVVAILAAGTYFLFFKKNTQTLENPVPIPSAVVEPELQTYSGIDFTFEYDQKFTAVKESEEEFHTRSGGNFRNNFRSYIGYLPAEFVEGVNVLSEDTSYETTPFTLWVFDNSKGLSIDAWYQNYWYYPFNWGDYTARRYNVDPQDIATVSGQEARSGVVGYKPGEPKFIYISHSGKMYLFRLVDDSEKTGEKILESFKFLDNSSNQLTACTEEAKICSDGSAVGRTGPNCEFADCQNP